VLYDLLADAVVVVHIAFVLFVAGGGVLVFRWPWVAALHLPAAAWGAWIELSGGVCPLTPLELRLRNLAGEAGYAGGFVEHYLVPLLYSGAITREIQIGLGVGVVILNAFVYAAVLHRRGKLPCGSEAAEV